MTQADDRSFTITHYPSPASTQITFRLELEASQHVVVDLYDVLGRRVASVVDEMMTAGEPEISSEIGGFPPGMYLYRAADTDSSSGSLIITRYSVLEDRHTPEILRTPNAATSHLHPHDLIQM